jgi:hypothetical protein
MKKKTYEVVDAYNNNHVIGRIRGINTGDIIKTSALQAKRLSKKCLNNIVILGDNKNYYYTTCLDGCDNNLIGWC